MPTRKIPLVNGEIYHIINRGVNHIPIFRDKRDYQKAFEILSYYRFASPQLRFSLFNRLSIDKKEEIWEQIKEKDQRLVTFISFCFMPNHFHFLIKQERDKGVTKFLANFQNSLTRYFNSRHRRSGHLFQGQFRAIRIETENQLLHTSRYIHLNPYTSYLLKNTQELKTYPWSSLQQYIEKDKEGICKTDTIMANFSSREKYLEFILDQKDYQRTLDQIKHLTLE